LTPVEIFLISFLLIGLSLLGMAAGVLLKRGSLKGSCGGLNQLFGGESNCGACSRADQCKKKRGT